MESLINLLKNINETFGNESTYIHLIDKLEYAIKELKENMTNDELKVFREKYQSIKNNTDNFITNTLQQNLYKYYQLENLNNIIPNKILINLIIKFLLLKKYHDNFKKLSNFLNTTTSTSPIRSTRSFVPTMSGRPAKSTTSTTPVMPVTPTMSTTSESKPKFKLGDEVLVNGQIKTNNFCREDQGENNINDWFANNQSGKIVDINPADKYGPLTYCVKFNEVKIGKYGIEIPEEYLSLVPETPKITIIEQPVPPKPTPSPETSKNQEVIEFYIVKINNGNVYIEELPFGNL